MALNPFVVQIERKPGGSFGESVNAYPHLPGFIAISVEGLLDK